MKKKRGRKPKNQQQLSDCSDDNVDIKKIAEKVKKEKIHYVNSKEFEDGIRGFYLSGTLTAYLGESVSKIANGLSYAPNFINYCVDTQTEALTQRGWLKYSELTKKDIILSYNIDEKRFAWSKILDLYVGKYKGKMHRLTLKALDALVTPNHKFVTIENGLQPVELLKTNNHLVLMGKHVKPNKAIYSNAFVELMGWAITEGHFALGKKTHSITIFQKIGPKADRIKNCMDKLGIKYKIYNWSNPEILGFYFNKKYANEIIRLAPKRIMSMEFILNLTQKQRLLLIQTMVDGDGSTRHKDDNQNLRTYVQKCEKHMDMFLIVCTLAGITASKILRKHRSRFGYSEYFVSNIYDKPKLTCRVENIDMHGGRPGAGVTSVGKTKTIGKAGKPNLPTHPYNGTVWCPTTEYGTFVCRRNGKIYVTGNSYRDEMVGDAIVKMMTALKHKKFNLDSGYSPFSYFTTIAFHAFINRIKKEKKHHETLEQYKEKMYMDKMIEGTENTGGHVYIDNDNNDDN